MKSKHRRASIGRWIKATLLQLALFLVVEPAALRAAEVSEYDLKALYLYHFTQFVTWPESDPESPLTIGIVGNNPFGDGLQRIIQQQAPEERKIEIREIRDIDSVSDCQILFINQSEKRRLSGILASIDKLPILTVGDDDTFALRGCVIGFDVEGKKVRIIVNKRAAAGAGLELSSKLLRVAQVR